MDENFDLENFVDLFDTAMMSDNPTVRKAFKNLMIVATLVNSENDPKIGPLREMVKTIEDLQQRVRILEATKQYSTYGPTTLPSTNPTWTVGTPVPYHGPNVTTVGISPTYTSTTMAGDLSAKYVPTYSLDHIFTKLDDK
jgi:hypothetical protein